MKPEEKARQQIDRLLEAAGWCVQDYNKLNLSAAKGVAVREFPLETGQADYVLFVDKAPIGVVEAKPDGATLSGVAEQSEEYLISVAKTLTHASGRAPFAYESTGIETFFRDASDPEPRSRRVFGFHRPETLGKWLAQVDTLRARLRRLPPLVTEGLRDCQIEAIMELDRSFADAKPRALIQMASGGGKTFTAVSFIYRLIKFANAKRVLFLVDRSNLGRQTRMEFQQYRTPDDGRIFTELYSVQHLTSNTLDPVAGVCITTIQRLYSMLKGEQEFDSELEERSLFDLEPRQWKPQEVCYNPAIPIETFDFVVTDECHRSIYHLWRPVLEYFDAFTIGLTATPSKQTLGFFNQNLITEYSHERAVADGVNVGYDVYRIRTQITEQGSTVDAGYYVDRRDKYTRKVRWEQLDDDLVYTGPQLDRDVVATDQIRTVIRTFKDRLFTEIFPGRSDTPKTLVFAKDDSHAEDIVHIVRDEFGKGNDFCKKITYRTTGENPEDLITSFRNSYNPRIAVTVDMISTGTDIRPLECLIFLRDVQSRTYFEQMKGRGARVISSTEFRAVTPDAASKTHFVIIDAVGVCERDKTDSRPLERKRSVPLDKLLISVALGKRDEDTLTSLASRLARLDRTIGEKERQEIQKAAKGKPLASLVHDLLDAFDPDKRLEKAKELFATESPTEEQAQEAASMLIESASAPFDNPDLRNKIVDIGRAQEQTIDTVSKDTLLFAGADAQAKEKAGAIVDSFQRFIQENKDELTALQVIYGQPHAQRHLTYEAIKQLAEAIGRPPYNLDDAKLWRAYQLLDESRVRGQSPDKVLTNIVSLVRFAVGRSEILEPFPAVVDRRFRHWLSQQEAAGKKFTAEQKQWLSLIKEHIASSLSIGMEDFEYTPFYERGGPMKVSQLFGPELDNVLIELNEVLAA